MSSQLVLVQQHYYLISSVLYYDSTPVLRRLHHGRMYSYKVRRSRPTDNLVFSWILNTHKHARARTVYSPKKAILIGFRTKWIKHKLSSRQDKMRLTVYFEWTMSEKVIKITYFRYIHYQTSRKYFLSRCWLYNIRVVEVKLTLSVIRRWTLTHLIHVYCLNYNAQVSQLTHSPRWYSKVDRYSEIITL